VRYVPVYRYGELSLRQRSDLSLASAPESDRYEELLVNPTVLTLTRQRGEIDCGGFDYVVIRHGNFFQFVAPIEGGQCRWLDAFQDPSGPPASEPFRRASPSCSRCAPFAPVEPLVGPSINYPVIREEKYIGRCVIHCDPGPQDTGRIMYPYGLRTGTSKSHVQALSARPSRKDKW
jgi:hypothetical protein